MVYLCKKNHKNYEKIIKNVCLFFLNFILYIYIKRKRVAYGKGKVC